MVGKVEEVSTDTPMAIQMSGRVGIMRMPTKGQSIPALVATRSDELQLVHIRRYIP